MSAINSSVSRRAFVGGAMAATAGVTLAGVSGCSQNKDAGSAPAEDSKATLVFKNGVI